MAKKRTSTVRGLVAVARYLQPYLRPHRKFIAIGMTAMFLEVIFRLIEPWPLKYVIDEVIAKATPNASDTMINLVVAAFAVVLAAGMRALCSYLMTLCFALAGTRAMSEVRGEVYAHLQRLSLRFHGTQKSGDLLTRMITDVGRLQDVAVTAALPLFGNVVSLIGMTTVMVVLDWQLAATVLCAFPVFLLVGSWSSKKITSAARQQRRREGALAGAANETLGAMRLVQSYGLEGVMQESFAVNNSKAMKDGVKASRLSAALERKTDLMVGVATGVVLCMGGWRVLHGELTTGELVVFLTYLKGAFKPMRDLAKYTGRLAKAAASGERILDILNSEPDIQDSPGAVTARAFEGRIELRDVTVEYSGKPALQNLSFTVPAGSSIGLIGESGSGKSTIASLLSRLQDPSQGQVLIDMQDIRHLTVDSVRSQVAIVLQESILFATTIRENIRYGRPDATDGEVEWYARQANAHDFIMATPDGYDTIVGERGGTLSGGQRQRIAIARAMLRDASIIILDEAMTGLDRDTSAKVLEAMRRLTAGRTTVIISHALEDIIDCDQILCLENGQVVEQGPTMSLLSSRSSHLVEMIRSSREAVPSVWF